MFKPELISSLKGYTAKAFFNDLTAGAIVGVVALPLSIAFAIASGVGPERGLYTSIMAGLCISLFGGSKFQIGGPTGAFAVIVYTVIQNFGYSGLVLSTIMAGIILILLGAFKMGGLVKFIPYTIVTGFTAGIAAIIAVGQIGNFLGLTTGNLPADIFGKIKVFVSTIETINWYAFFIGAVSLAFLFIWPKINEKIPGSLIVIIIITVATVIIQKTTGLSLDTLGSKYGIIPSTIPAPTLPTISTDLIVKLFPSAVSIAALTAIQGLLSAVVADGIAGTKHNSNTELIAEGIANIASSLFGGIPATGAIARTTTNVKNGAKSPISGIIHSLVLVLVMLFLGKLTALIPMAALAAVLINVAWNMAGFPAVKALMKGQKSDFCVFIVTFLITVFVDVTVAIGVGLGFAAFFFIKKMIDVSEVQAKRQVLTGGMSGDGTDEVISIPEGVLVYEIDGPLFFGTVRKFELAVESAGVEYKVLILRMRNTMYLDAGGLRALEQAKALCDKKGVVLVLSGIHTQPYMLLEKTGMALVIGKENIFDNITNALIRGSEIAFDYGNTSSAFSQKNSIANNVDTTHSTSSNSDLSDSTSKLSSSDEKQEK